MVLPTAWKLLYSSFAPDTTTGTFQLNSLEVYGIVTTNANCSGASIVTNVTLYSRLSLTFATARSRFLNW